MSIQEGFDAVQDALFPNRKISVSTCTRCKVDLYIDPLNGNTQANYTFRFGTKVLSGFWPGILNGCMAKYEWEADLCNQCLIDLTKWIDPDYYKEKANDGLE